MTPAERLQQVRWILARYGDGLLKLHEAMGEIICAAADPAPKSPPVNDAAKLRQVGATIEDWRIQSETIKNRMLAYIEYIVSTTPQEKPMPDEMSDKVRRIITDWEQTNLSTHPVFKEILAVLPAAPIDPDERAREWLRKANLTPYQIECAYNFLCTDCADGDMPEPAIRYVFIHRPHNRKCEASGLRRLMR